LADQHNLPLAGGDTSESPCNLVLADIVLVGSAQAGRAIRREGGHVGDALYVTGELGGAAAELAAMERLADKLRSKPPRVPTLAQLADHPQLYPQPRIDVGLALLRRRLATAAIDLSDGLSTDLTHLCRESGVGAEVSAAALDFALNGGEDYELLFTAPPAARVPRSVAGVRITRVGRLVRGGAITLLDPGGRKRRLEPGGWEHFAGKH
jgi:thiamine-monophosphate kinase